MSQRDPATADGSEALRDAGTAAGFEVLDRQHRRPALLTYLLAYSAATLVTAVLLVGMSALIRPADHAPARDDLLLRLEYRDPAPVAASELEPVSLPPEPDVPDESVASDALQDMSEPGTAEAEHADLPASPVDVLGVAREMLDKLSDEEFAALMAPGAAGEFAPGRRNDAWAPGPSSPGQYAAPDNDVYVNVYGDTELKISDNCSLQMRSRQFGATEFDRYIPPSLACNKRAAMDLSGLDDYLGGR